jgi:hypothetical protein
MMLSKGLHAIKASLPGPPETSKFSSSFSAPSAVSLFSQYGVSPNALAKAW